LVDVLLFERHEVYCTSCCRPVLYRRQHSVASLTACCWQRPEWRWSQTSRAGDTCPTAPARWTSRTHVETCEAGNAEFGFRV